jgi:hypothetical protein
MPLHQDGESKGWWQVFKDCCFLLVPPLSRNILSMVSLIDYYFNRALMFILDKNVLGIYLMNWASKLKKWQLFKITAVSEDSSFRLLFTMITRHGRIAPRTSSTSISELSSSNTTECLALVRKGSIIDRRIYSAPYGRVVGPPHFCTATTSIPVDPVVFLVRIAAAAAPYVPALPFGEATVMRELPPVQVNPNRSKVMSWLMTVPAALPSQG